MEKKINDIEFISSEIKKILEMKTSKDFEKQKELLDLIKKDLREIKYNKTTSGCIHCNKMDLNSFKLLGKINVSSIYYRILSGATINIKFDTIKLILCEKCLKEFNVEERTKAEFDKKEQKAEFEIIARRNREIQSNINKQNNLQRYVQTRGKSGYGSPWKAINSIGSDLIPYNEEIAKELKNMNYRDFLKTDYWWAVSSYIRYRANYSCSLCDGISSKTHIHHKTYEHRGQEHLHNSDLICLCEDCHAKQHDIIDKP